MGFSAQFIARPVATILLMAAVIMAGYEGYINLPVAALPQADLPTISVSANRAGASPDTMAAAVATHGRAMRGDTRLRSAAASVAAALRSRWARLDALMDDVLCGASYVGGLPA